MKKFLALLMAMIMCMILWSCNNETDDEETDGDSEGKKKAEETTESVSVTLSEDELVDEVIAEAQDMLDAGKYDDAIDFVKKEMKKYPDASELDDMLEECKAAKTEAEKQAKLDEAEALADSGKYVDAINLLEEVVEDDDDYRDAYDRYCDEYRDVKLEEAEELYDDGDVLGAFCIIDEVIYEIGEDDDLTAAADKYRGEYAAGILEEVNELEKDGKIDEAKELLEDALAEIPDDPDLTDKKAVLDDYKCDGLDTLSPINGGFTWNDSNADPVDVFGNRYDDGNYVVFHAGWSDHDGEQVYSAEYNLAGAYDTLDLTITPYADFGANGSTYLCVYVNGVLRYTSPRIQQKTQPFSIPTLDISDADYLTIQVAVGAHGCVIMSDVILTSSPNYVSTLDDTKTSLSTLDTFNGSISWSNEYPDSRVGADYTYAQNYTSMHAKWSDHDGAETYSVEYYVNKGYKSLSFNLDAKNDFGKDAKSVVKVYVDDKLVYTSKEITQKTARFNTGEIDISKADYVKIEFDIGSYGCIIMSDALLTNK